ncbi:MAG TPA: hypothetical protein VEX69_09415 [Candidatus Limnocylindria bacterium]|nr:hypothetical protein [Candidatus Limnocylindria bacterium]
MEILWPALGISVIVVFVFFVLAQHWQRTLRHHSWTIRRLIERMRDLEEVGDPEFRRRLSQIAPSPLEQVFVFSLRLDDHFWRETLHASPEDLKFIRSFGTFLGSVKIERWRGRTVATIMEVLPESRLAGWQTRSLDLYSADTEATGAITLWEVPLARPRGPAEIPPSLELLLRQNSLELWRREPSFAPETQPGVQPSDGDTVFLRVPLDAALLSEYRSHEPLSSSIEAPANGNSWQAFYSCGDQNLGYEWQLSLRDLEKKAEWEQWKILEPAPVQTGTE